MDMSEIWVVDDDASVRFVLATALRDAGYEVREFDHGDAALIALDEDAAPSLLFTDVRMPGRDGIAVLGELRERLPSLPVVVVSAFTDLASTVGAFRGGAFEFLSKPFDLDDAVAIARRALAAGQGPAVANVPRTERRAPVAELLGESPAMRELFRVLGKVAPTELDVLIVGETGTGKELVARALHRHSPRAQGPFVALNTAAIPADLLESELFGHEAGAFTGAARRTAGRFEQAAGGTLFLDEIGDMPLSLQTRLLRVLAGGEFYRVGGREVLRADVRIVAATHQDLEQKVADGSFRADLLHRLDVVRLAVPPLRERREDVALLAREFLEHAARELNVDAKRFSAAAEAALARHAWPGNVRELENLCRRLAVLAPGLEVLPDDLPRWPQASLSSTTSDAGDEGNWPLALRVWALDALRRGHEPLYADARTLFDQALLDAALELTGGHRQQAAKRLGLGRNTITRKLGTSRRRHP